jgi:hypothetical protein
MATASHTQRDAGQGLLDGRENDVDEEKLKAPLLRLRDDGFVLVRAQDGLDHERMGCNVHQLTNPFFAHIGGASVGIVQCQIGISLQQLPRDDIRVDDLDVVGRPGQTAELPNRGGILCERGLASAIDASNKDEPRLS